MTQIDWAQISAKITAVSGEPFQSKRTAPIVGGCINQAWRLQGKNKSWFVKLNHRAHLDMFIAEQAGLEALAATDTIKVPEPLCCGVTTSHAYLVMEYMDLKHPPGKGSDRMSEKLGEQLAAMHRHRAAQHGWHQDNTIGSTPQINIQAKNWSSFWTQRRLVYQFELAAQKGHHGRLQQRGQQLLNVIDKLLAGYEPQPSLLHGDLWSGNVATMADGCPVIFDPAVYCGDRETDLAMTELFGGFSPIFYDAYRNAWPLEEGYPLRKILYNLYHVLNHLNLFGGAYRSQAEAMIDRLLSEAGHF